MLLCAEPFARRHDLAWSPLADPALHRGYELAQATLRVGSLDGSMLAWMEPLLAVAIGAVGGPVEKPTTADQGSSGPDRRSRLAAWG
ncbi:hypothetical protein ACFQ1L_17020 [Phytohabitans flavus]